MNGVTIPFLVVVQSDIVKCASFARIDTDGDTCGCAACSAFSDMAVQQDLTSEGINPLSYLGDSFDASTDLFTAEDALKLGLDPLEIEELQMLADASIVTDPAIEDSFRLERQ